MRSARSACTLHFSGRVVIREDVARGAVVLQTPWRRISLKSPLPGVRAVVDVLAGRGCTSEEAFATALLAGGTRDASHAGQLLTRLIDAGFLSHTLVGGGAPVLSVVPLTGGFQLASEPLPADSPVVLSRFAFVRRQDGRLVLQSPISRGEVELHDSRGATLLSALACPRDPQELLEAVPALPAGVVDQCVTLLAGAGMVGPVGADGTLAEDRDASLAHWEFHDLLFHSRCHTRRHGDAYGKHWRFRDRFAPAPAVKDPEAKAVVPLGVPDMAWLAENDIPFTRVLEARRSHRHHGERCLSLGQLGEFLYRSARTREVVAADPVDLRLMPYPTGGGLAAEEVYVVVHACDGLDAGLYHYDSNRHRLVQVSGRTPDVDGLLAQAACSTGTNLVPQVLIVLTVRFRRLAWKYQSVAYALALKDVGGLYQTMYLVATAMGLAPCALGGGDSDLFARAARLDGVEEPSIGEFVLGTLAASATAELDWPRRSDSCWTNLG